MIDEAIGQLTPIVGQTRRWRPWGWTGPPGIATTERARPRRDPNGSPRPSPGPSARSSARRSRELLESDEFVDEAPATVYAKLLDQGTYLASVSTMYRVLHEHDEVRERRRQATHPAHKKPELIATGPNEVWSWDITKLHGPEKWTYYYLYVILDIYSRYAVGLDAGPGRTGRALQDADRRVDPKQGVEPRISSRFTPTEGHP